MKTRWICLALSLCLLLTAAVCPVSAANADSRLEVIRVTGILVGDGHGNLNLPNPVTRAEFTKMMVAASAQKDTVADSSGTSLFKDVKRDHWAGGYIKAAVEQGWMVGYLDGTFRPERTITLEEGCTALLRLLGYDANTLAGSYPTAQLLKAQSVGLQDDLAGEAGHVLTRNDCVTLFYNLLTAETSGGAVYGTTLGYTVKNGEVDYSALITADTKGPYVAGETVIPPFGTENVTVLRDGKTASLAEIRPYDVYYYHTNLRTVWAFHDRVTGTLTAVSPSQTAPTSVTVAGTTYAIGTSEAAYQFSGFGDLRVGDAVTLLLGMDSSVVRVIRPDQTESAYFGLVTASAAGASTETTAGAGGASIQVTTKIVCTDGTERTFYHSGAALNVGDLVSAVTTGSETTVQKLGERSVSGRFSTVYNKLGDSELSPDVEILDTDTHGNYAVVYPSRLADVMLKAGDVRYYVRDDAGRISRLILNRATGDLWRYGYLTTAKSTGNFAVYSGFSGGQPFGVSGTTAYPVKDGGVAMIYEEGELVNMRPLAQTTISQLLERTAMSGIRQFPLDENVQVILRDKNDRDNCYVTELSRVDSERYTLTGWYDDLSGSAGGRIRVILAEEK